MIIYQNGCFVYTADDCLLNSLVIFMGPGCGVVLTTADPPSHVNLV